MTGSKRVVAAIAATGMAGLAWGPQPVEAAARKPARPAIQVTLPPSAAPTPYAPTPDGATPKPAPSARPVGPKSAGPVAVVALPLDLKDPYTAYTLGMLPFASSVAARYVGTSRLSWRIDDELSGAATRQTLMDWGLLVGGTGIIGIGAASPSNLQGQFAFLGAAALLAIPFSHWLLYAPYWGEEAVRLNRAAMTRHGFEVDEPAAPTP